MPITITCSCGRQLRAKDELAGKRVSCPGCGAILAVPSSAKAAVAAAAAPSPISVRASLPAAEEPQTTQNVPDIQAAGTNHGVLALAAGTGLAIVGITLTVAPGSNRIWYGAVWVGMETMLAGLYCLISQIRYGRISKRMHIVFVFFGLLLALGFVVQSLGAAMSPLTHRLLLGAPWIAVYVVGLFSTLAFLRRYRRPAVLVFLAMGVMLLARLAVPIVQEGILGGWSARGPNDWAMRLTGVIGMFLDIAALGLLLAAAFAGRRTAAVNGTGS